MRFAASALSTNAELAAQIVHAAGALPDAVVEVTLGDAIADTDVHSAAGSGNSTRTIITHFVGQLQENSSQVAPDVSAH